MHARSFAIEAKELFGENRPRALAHRILSGRSEMLAFRIVPEEVLDVGTKLIELAGRVQPARSRMVDEVDGAAGAGGYRRQPGSHRLLDRAQTGRT